VTGSTDHPVCALNFEELIDRVLVLSTEKALRMRSRCHSANLILEDRRGASPDEARLILQSWRRRPVKNHMRKGNATLEIFVIRDMKWNSYTQAISSGDAADQFRQSFCWRERASSKPNSNAACLRPSARCLIAFWVVTEAVEKEMAALTVFCFHCLDGPEDLPSMPDWHFRLCVDLPIGSSGDCPRRPMALQ
jgi:hypothetical protein